MQNKNEIISYEAFKNFLNKKLFDSSIAELLQKIANNPSRYTGLFRPTKANTKLIQNITQSHEIRFGDALEIIFERYFEETGFTILGKKLININYESLNIDQLLLKNNKVYMIEQKVRDDHDSSKKTGQFNNFINKYIEVSKLYQDKQIIPIMWFIDDTLMKNKKYYQEEMNKMKINYQCKPKLLYGKELFIDDFNIEIWNEVIYYLKIWKETLPDTPLLNLDINAEETFNEIKDLKPNVFIKIFSNEDIKDQILPILFPSLSALKLLVNYFKTKDDSIYDALAKEIETFIATNTI